jgi:hypothetical protein
MTYQRTRVELYLEGIYYLAGPTLLWQLPP